ncbi:MAG: hypothetical protein A3E78_12705 [Alphaproteobacteria bacterium RIFCSPHIGHO2_12_FULL_63_12]|nr:MAG: hypothetical protein A3E78_12705 [Alphaproteobacteria bacterium RIFCSPHIGHO2_12_FULL_63_12]
MIDLSEAALSPPAGVTPRKWARLSSFLGALPPAAAARLFAALEAAPAGGALPSGALLQSLRARLISEEAPFPPRKLSAQRLFFGPFEDFFVSHRRGRKRRARIDRASLGPIWALVLGDAACADAARAATRLDEAIARGEAELAPLRRDLFAAAAEGFAILIAHAEDDAAFRADLSARLGADQAGGDQARPGALHDLAELALLLPAADHLLRAQDAFPRPVSTLTEEDLYRIRRLYADAAGDAPSAAGYVLTAIAARMDAPWRAMRLYYHLTRAKDETLPHARADAATVAETLFDDLEGLARGLERDADDDPDTEDAPARLSHFADFAHGLDSEAAQWDDGVARARVEACRDVAASALARFAETALARLRRHHPVRHAGGSTRLMALRPDIDRPLDRAIEKDARAAARFLAQAESLGERMARPSAASTHFADAVRETARYAGDLVAEIRAAEGDQRLAARRRMEATLRAAEGLLPEDEIALLKERANVAAVSA